MEAYNVKIDTFEGPLDLLLHLITKMEIDIADISVAKVTDQYVGYIRAMQHLQLDVASEYLVMAATLLQLKSKQLLPPLPHDHEEESPDFQDEPTREGLIRQLMEYKAYKEAASYMREQEEQRLELFSRPSEDLSRHADGLIQPYDGSLNFSDLLFAYSKMVERKRWKQKRTRTVQREEMTIEQQMERLEEFVEHERQTSFFSFFVEVPHVGELVTTFIALLELIKRRVVTTRQREQDIDIIWAKGTPERGETIAIV